MDDNFEKKGLDIIHNSNIGFPNFVIIGQQLYKVMLYNYLFINVTQNYKKCKSLARGISQKSLLKNYVDEKHNKGIWDNNEYGFNYKIRVSLGLIGYEYYYNGYDSIYSDFIDKNSEEINAYLSLPIDNYTHLLESYAWNSHHVRIDCKVVCFKTFSNDDIVYKAKITYKNDSFEGYSESKKSAVEEASKKCVHKILSYKDLKHYAEYQQIFPVTLRKLDLNSFMYSESDEKITNFNDNYNLDCLLTRYTMLTRSDLNIEELNEMGLKPLEVLNGISLVHFRNGLIELGKSFILVKLLKYVIQHKRISSFDALNLDANVVKIGTNEIQNELEKKINLDDFLLKFFDKIDFPNNRNYTERDRRELSAGFITNFYLSNFSPDIKFSRFFNEDISNFYKYSDLKNENDYRYDMISFFSNLGISINTHHRELGNGIFHAEVIIAGFKEKHQFIIEDESMRFAKNEVWKKSYQETIGKFLKFIEVPSYEINKDLFNIILKSILSIKENEFVLEKFGFMSAKNFKELDVEDIQQVLIKIKRYCTIDYYNRFKETIIKSNSKYLVNINSVLYRYTDLITTDFRNVNTTCRPITYSISNIDKLYSNICNPSIKMDKLFIQKDYKNISLIENASDTIKKYALDINLDAVNLFEDLSKDVQTYYNEKTKEKNLITTDIGILSSTMMNGISLTILDSHSSVSNQILKMISNTKLEKIIIACGYCFASGISMIGDVFRKVSTNNIPMDLYVGSLQNYDQENLSSLVTGIDKNTVYILQDLLENNNFNLFTCNDRFYHGKIYYFEESEKAIVILGSSNISKSAYISNYELNIAITAPKNSEVIENFKKWISQLNRYSKKITYLDEKMFGDNELKQDGSVLLKRMSLSDAKTRVQSLTDAEVKYRLNLWLSYTPSYIAEDLGIPSLPNYIVFVYSKYRLLVLESFESSNAYYCIKYDDSFEDVLNRISDLSKTEIFEYSNMPKRGYHISNKFTVERNVRYYFRRSENGK